MTFVNVGNDIKHKDEYLIKLNDRYTELYRIVYRYLYNILALSPSSGDWSEDRDCLAEKYGVK